MTTRLATADDHHDQIGWLRADQPERGVRIVVEEVDGQLVGAALRASGPLQPHLDFLQLGLAGSASVELVDAVLALAPNPVLVRGLPGTPEHALALEAGASVLDRVPASRIDPSDPAVRAWVRDHEGPTRPGSEYSLEQVTELWIDHYVANHQHFGVTDDRSVLRASLGPFVERGMLLDLCRFVESDGGPVAAAFVFREGPVLMGLVDALNPGLPDARRHVAVAMAALLQAVPPEPFELDGHESSAHYPAVLATIPNVTAGELTPMELLRLERR